MKIQEENDKVSSEICQVLLKQLHAVMLQKVEQHLLLGPQDDEEGYSFQSSEFKVWLFDLRSLHFATVYLRVILCCV